MTSVPRDENHIPVMQAQSNASRVPVVLYADPTTHRLLVDATFDYTGVTDGEVVDAGNFGTMILGTDGSNYQVIGTDSDGHLQVDVLSGGGAGVQYTEGDSDASITGTALMLEGAANALVAAPGTAADGMLVNLGANNDVTITGDALTALQAIDTDSTTIIGHLDGVEGLLTTIDADTGAIATSVASIDTKTPALGQALAAASVPVILPAATITTLTPPAAITGFGTSANQTTIIGHLDGVETLLGTIDADTSGIITAVQIMDDWDNGASDGASVSGDVAHDSADAGEPVKIGMKTYSPDGTTPGTAVAEGDRTDAKGNLDGQLFVQTEHPRWGSYHVDGSSALTDATVAASPGAGFQTVITNISFSSGAATAINMFLEEGASKIFGPIYLEAVAGRGFCTPAGFRKHVTAATALTITTSAAIAHSVDIQYETIAV